jgi:hypothetical protein
MKPKVVLSKLVLMNHYHWIFPFSKNQFILKIFEIIISHDVQSNSLLWYCHISGEIIHIIVCDNYEGFQHLNFIFFTKSHFNTCWFFDTRASTNLWVLAWYSLTQLWFGLDIRGKHILRWPTRMHSQWLCSFTIQSVFFV